MHFRKTSQAPRLKQRRWASGDKVSRSLSSSRAGKYRRVQKIRGEGCNLPLTELNKNGWLGNPGDGWKAFAELPGSGEEKNNERVLPMGLRCSEVRSPDFRTPKRCRLPDELWREEEPVRSKNRKVLLAQRKGQEKKKKKKVDPGSK